MKLPRRTALCGLLVAFFALAFAGCDGDDGAMGAA